MNTMSSYKKRRSRKAKGIGEETKSLKDERLPYRIASMLCGSGSGERRESLHALNTPALRRASQVKEGPTLRARCLFWTCI